MSHGLFMDKEDFFLCGTTKTSCTHNVTVIPREMKTMPYTFLFQIYSMDLPHNDNNILIND